MVKNLRARFLSETVLKLGPPCSALPGDVELYRDRRGSISTQQTDHTERFEIEESAEFLPAVDISSSHIMEDLEYQVYLIVNTQQTNYTERFEIEESAEFLPAVDISSSHIMEDPEYQVQHIIPTQQTDHTESFEIEESAEFLPAVDISSSHIMEALEYQVQSIVSSSRQITWRYSR